MKNIYFIILTLFIPLNIYAGNFPLREKYTDVQPISTSDLHTEFGKATIIDTRSAFEYNIIRIKGAKNILVSKINFRRLLGETVNDNTSKVVFYCNGIKCAKSYKAAVKAAESGYTNVYVYDAGVFEWTKTYPDKAVLLGKKPADPHDIISENDLQSKLLDKDIFAKEAKSVEAYLIDTRDANQRKKTPDFARSAKRIPLDTLAEMFDDEKFMKDIDGKTLYIMDAVGKQIQWIQYHLISKGVDKYYFLKNGVWSFYGEKGASKNVAQDKKQGSPQEKAPESDFDNALEVRADTEVQFKIEGQLFELIKRKIPEEQFQDALKEVQGKDLSQSHLFDLLKKHHVPDEKIDAIVEEANEYLVLIKNIKKVAPTALRVNILADQIKQKEEVLEAAQSEEVQAGIEEEIGELKTQVQTSGESIAEVLSYINEGQLEEVPAVLDQLGYTSEESDIISLHIRTQANLLKTLDTMDSIIESIANGKQEIEEMEKARKGAQTDEEKAQITEELKKISDRIKGLTHDFSIVLTGLDKEKLFQKEEKETDWNKELQEVFSPLIVQLKQVTERPRQMEILRSVIGYYENLLPRITDAVDKINSVVDEVSNPDTLKQISELDEFWTQQEKEVTDKLEAARHQLFELEKDKMSFTETMEYLYGSVFKQRGINILYAVIAFLVTFLIFHLLRLLIIKINPLQRFPKYMILGNLIDVLLYILSFLAATTATAVVLYVYGNWLVLGVLVIILLGVVWAARNTLPDFVEQIKILLGFGPVRQGEKVMIDGIPYRVEMMGVYSYLNNPLLTGGTLRLPLKDLVGMRSRPYDENEPWFPCKEGDYVLIDGLSTWRQVKRQTPQTVEFNWFEMLETMPTRSFMGRKIFNISAAPFWAGINFSIAYKHRFEALGDLRDKLSKFVEEEIKKQPYGEHILYPWVDLAGLADDSSLNFMVWIQAAPEAASKYGAMSLHLNQIALEAANKYGWEIIRFTPVELHHLEQAKALLNNSGTAG